MATVKKGMLTTTGEWWKHLRWTKRVFWKGERQAARQFVRREAATDTASNRPDKSHDASA
jgi:hypothetical protein